MDEMKTGKDAKWMGKMAGCPEVVDSRPDLNHHLETHLTSISTPELTAPEDSGETDRGVMPPMDKGGRMNAGDPWVPMGRKNAR